MTQSVAVIGLGYVGLPLAVAFGRVVETIGFDVDAVRVQGLQQGRDRNLDVDASNLQAPHLRFTADAVDLAAVDVFVIAVPTPVTRSRTPDLQYLQAASRTVGEALARRGTDRGAAIVVYESTVYPGCTEEECIPVLEAASGLRAGPDFKVGYSPERINPGDTEHTLETIVKVVGAQDPETLDALAALYGRVVKAGIHRAPDIRTAEAAKVIENTQRDLNIALMNELAILFHHLGIDTQAVLAAAGTKWNFLPFRPGLVGGHCIPEDPYYLTYKAETSDFHPQLILAGRRINDNMGRYVAQQTVKLLIQAGKPVKGGRVLVLGVAFKENVSDVRNTRVRDLVKELESFGCEVVVHDPVAGEKAVGRLGLRVDDGANEVEAVVLAVPHREILADDGWRGRLVPGGVLVDVKGAWKAKAEDWIYWQL